MAKFGNIKSWDSKRGAGTIIPESGSDALPFKQADLEQPGQEPKHDQRYSYELASSDWGRNRAVKLKLMSQEKQAEEDDSKLRTQARQQAG